MPPRDSRRRQLALHIEHAYRHIAAAADASSREEWCAARAHLREAQIDTRWALKHATPLCEHLASE